MSDDQNSVTQMIVDLKLGDESAAADIWNNFFHRVRALADKKLGAAPQRTRDAEDIALSAMNALCVGAREGRFRQLENRDDLWQILCMITSRKVANEWRKVKRKQEVGESVIHVPKDDGAVAGMEQIASGKPDEAFLDQLSETCRELIAMLDDKLQPIAMMKMEGFTNEEIAEKQDRSVKTIERYLKMIRHRWQAPRE